MLGMLRMAAHGAPAGLDARHFGAVCSVNRLLEDFASNASATTEEDVARRATLLHYSVTDEDWDLGPHNNRRASWLLSQEIGCRKGERRGHTFDGDGWFHHRRREHGERVRD